MMTRFCIRVIAAFFVFIVASDAYAQYVTRPDIISRPSKKSPLVAPGTQYAFEVTCKPLPGVAFDNPGYARNRSLFVVIAPNVPTTTDKIPNDVLAAIQVYSIGTDKDTRQEIISGDRTCNKSFLVNGSKRVGFVVTQNWMNSFSDTVFGQVLSGALALMSPLYSLFAGGVLPTLITGNIASIATIQSTTEKILTALNRGQNYTHPPVTLLRTGTYVIRDGYAQVTIKIRRVSSIVLDQNPFFKDDLKSQINTANIKLDVAHIDTTCRGGRNDIDQLGFRSDWDVAYGLTLLSAHAGFNKKESITCLTPALAKLVAADDKDIGKTKDNKDSFWSNFRAEFKFNQSDLTKSNFDQPSFDSVSDKIDNLVVKLAQYARNTPPPASSVSDLTKRLNGKVVVIDNTSSVAIGDDSTAVERFDAIKKLTNKGYIRFGCYAPTDASTDQNVDGAAAIFLVFKAPNDATRTSFDSALAIRPHFKSESIDALSVSDNRAWIDAVLTKRNYKCNGFSVDKPAAAAAN
jgi:hypothetical protein